MTDKNKESNKGHREGRIAEPERYIGFVYLITHNPTSRKYVGKKNFWFSSGTKGCKGKSFDRGSDRWKDSCWRTSDWKTYCGSSKLLIGHIKLNQIEDYKFEILRQCRSRGVLSFCEAEEQWRREVLTAKLPDGEYEYFNGTISSIRFRPVENHTDETKRRMSVAATGKKKPKGFQDGNTNGKGLPQRDKTLYTFENVDGSIYTGIRFNFCKEFGLNSGGVSSIINNRTYKCKGWSVKGDNI